MSAETQNTDTQDTMVDMPETEAAPAQTIEEKLTAERDEWKDKSYRLAAEMENLKKRTDRDIADARAYGMTKFARELLAVQDNLERATMALEGADMPKETSDAMLEGMKMVSDQLGKAFDSVQIEKIKTIGEALNPELHQAVMQIPSEEEEGTIVQEMQAGYTIADRLLRPAMVGVATKG